MTAYIFDPLWDELATAHHAAALEDAGIAPVVVSHPGTLRDHKQLYRGKGARILCINPDYVNWSLQASDYNDIPNLCAILGAATSFSWIDGSCASKKDIPIVNIRHFSTEAVAEWAIMMMLNVARQIPRLSKDGYPNDFDKDFMSYRGIELHGKTAAIIGMGNIGAAIARRCEGLGMKVVYWSRSKKDCDYTYTELPKLMKAADVIFPTLAINEETKQLITPTLLRSVRPSAMIISVVHGLFDEKLVLDMVSSGDLYGFGYEAEPETFGQHDGNVWAAPAYAWTTDTSMANSMNKWVENMVQAAEGSFPNRVN
jgi:glycerate dehydrogenase